MVDVLVACARVLLAYGWAMNGIHSYRFDCYRIPAGALQQSHLLGCMLHAGGSGFSIMIPTLLMHNVDVVWLSVLGFYLTDVFFTRTHCFVVLLQGSWLHGDEDGGAR